MWSSARPERSAVRIAGMPGERVPAVTPAIHGILADGGTVITATHRLARTLRLDWDRSQAASGLQVWPSADILPLDAWLRRGWDAALVLGTGRPARAGCWPRKNPACCGGG
jgi:hypothetical protein